MDDADQPARDDRPPVLGTWRAVYAVVLVELALLAALFHALARWAS